MKWLVVQRHYISQPVLDSVALWSNYCKVLKSGIRRCILWSHTLAAVFWFELTRKQNFCSDIYFSSLFWDKSKPHYLMERNCTILPQKHQSLHKPEGKHANRITNKGSNIVKTLLSFKTFLSEKHVKCHVYNNDKVVYTTLADLHILENLEISHLWICS